MTMKDLRYILENSENLYSLTYRKETNDWLIVYVHTHEPDIVPTELLLKFLERLT